MDSGREVSGNDSMCTVCRLDAEPAAVVDWEAGLLGIPEFTFCCKMAHDVIPQ